MGKILSVVERAYRGTVEEQDDTALWFTWTVKKGGALIDVLLRGNAVNYAVQGQDASGLTFGGSSFGGPAVIEHDLETMIKDGIQVYAVKDDLESRGVDSSRILKGIRLISAAEIASLFGQFDHIWHW